MGQRKTVNIQPIQQPAMVQQVQPQMVQQVQPQMVQQVQPQMVQPVYIQPTNQKTGVYVSVHKDYVKATHNGISKKSGQPFTSILIKLSDDFSFWMDSRVAFTSIYTNYVELIIQPEKEYKNANKEKVTQYPAVLGSTIINIFETQEI